MLIYLGMLQLNFYYETFLNILFIGSFKNVVLLLYFIIIITYKILDTLLYFEY